MGKYDERPYTVGKGKPPFEHRWKKGQSGNPRGPKRQVKPEDASLNELLAVILNEPVTVTMNNRTVRMPKKKAIVLSLVHDAANGTPAQRLKVFNALAKVNAFDLVPGDRQLDPQTFQDKAREVVEQLAADFGYNTTTGAYDDPENQKFYE